MNVANFWLPRLSCSCRSKALLKIERAEASHHLVEAEGPRHRGLGACKTAGTLAEPAGRTDCRRGELARFAGRPCHQPRKCRAVDDLIPECDVTAEQQCGSARAFGERALRTLEGARDAQELGAIRHFHGFDE